MFNIGEVPVPVCHGVTRRSFLQVGTTGLAGMTLPSLMNLQAQGAVGIGGGKIKNCITIFLVGSPGHLDTWDMKPDAPAEIRGKFQPISTNVAGIQICEHFPLMSRMMDKVALVRSLHHKTGSTHENGQRWMMTGHEFNADSVKPHSGSVISRVFGQKSELPANVILPAPIGNTGAGPLHGQSAAYLGSAHEPFFLNSDPARPDFKVADLEPPKGLSEFRLDARQKLLGQLDAMQRRTETRSTQMHDSSYERAFRLLTSPKAKEALDLNKEADTLRDRYGRNTFGQSCLMARRLIEGGVRYVTVNHFDTVFNLTCWDMHADGGGLNNTYLDYERHLCPQFDLAFTALIEDLDQRGLLQETVVAVLSEMGRTPRINPRGGRDHYPSAWTNFLCGGNIRGGQVVGSTDKQGARPNDNPVEPPQMLASIYHGMGINLDTTMMPGPGERPVRLIEAEPIRQLFA
ncbi:hypothetical protein ETAA8_60330 [Anatilimnocola aggregata]|uniref:DUF1501 domain-containing protein n=1 Tax=Anatilimnocola aggregata TaxID=2528021 RepID=A0A517YL10_9BACT|nr:DUF1501 domain-containing protein [Anatilimnocola aggregata]QDU30884.1 hypothetical protein ETAA8_60330 [Anatilimnocola aggregata]